MSTHSPLSLIHILGGEQLRRKIESMGVRVHTSKNTREIVQEGFEARKTMRFADGSELEVDFIVFSTGIRPRDKLATQCGLDAVSYTHLDRSSANGQQNADVSPECLPALQGY